MHSFLPKRSSIIACVIASLAILLSAIQYYAAASEFEQYSLAMLQPEAATGLQSLIGIYIWIAVTVVFSIGLNLLIHKNERKTAKLIAEQTSAVEPELVKLPLPEKAKSRQGSRNKKLYKPRHTFAYQREFTFDQLKTIYPQHQDRVTVDRSA